MKKASLVLMLVSLLVAGCGGGEIEPQTGLDIEKVSTTESPCDDGKITSYINDYSNQYSEWIDALDLASSTPKINLAPQIENLQRIKREITPLEPPLCLQLSHDSTIQYMEKMIEGFLGYMSGKTDVETAKLFEEGGALLDISNAELNKIIECMPNCAQNYKN